MKYKWGAVVTQSGKARWVIHLIDESGKTRCGRQFDDWIPEKMGKRCVQCLRVIIKNKSERIQFVHG